MSRTGPARVSGQVEASPRARERMNGGLKAARPANLRKDDEMPRDKTANVQLKLRMKEWMRANIEAAAKERGISMNAEIIRRLERSFWEDDLVSRIRAELVE